MQRWKIIHRDQIWNRRAGRRSRRRIDGERPLIARDQGTLQGGVISPLLANIFLHHVFDEWMSREYSDCPFKRYADDVVIHCSSQQRVQEVKATVETRLRRCKLEAHPDKARIVYCLDSNHTQKHRRNQFNFLGYGFQLRRAQQP